MENLHNIQITNLSKEFGDTKELEQVMQNFNVTSYIEYLNFVIIHGLKTYLMRELLIEFNATDELIFNFKPKDILSIIKIEDEENPAKCKISFNFIYENKTITLQ